MHRVTHSNSSKFLVRFVAIWPWRVFSSGTFFAYNLVYEVFCHLAARLSECVAVWITQSRVYLSYFWTEGSLNCVVSLRVYFTRSGSWWIIGKSSVLVIKLIVFWFSLGIADSSIKVTDLVEWVSCAVLSEVSFVIKGREAGRLCEGPLLLTNRQVQIMCHSKINSIKPKKLIYFTIISVLI